MSEEPVTPRRRRHPIALAAILGMAALLPGTAALGAQPIEDATGVVDSKINDLTDDADTKARSAVQQQAQSAQGAAASANGSAVSLSVLDNHVVTVSGTSATAQQDEASSEATVVAVLGHTVIGSEASSDSGDSESTTGLLHESCEASDGQLCVALLYGTAAADTTDDGSSSSSDTAVASACVGGDQTDPMTECGGPISVVIAESHSDAATSSDGSAQASQYTALADLCLGGENEQSGVCEGLGLLLLPASSSSSAAPGSDGESAGDAATAVIEASGEEAAAIDQAQEIALPPGCPSSGAICIALSEVATSAAAGSAASGATGVDLQVPTPGGVLVDGQVSDGETSGTAARTQVLGEGPDAEPEGKPRGRLATTGADLLRLLVLAGMVLSAGLALRIRRHRRTGDA